MAQPGEQVCFASNRRVLVRRTGRQLLDGNDLTSRDVARSEDGARTTLADAPFQSVAPAPCRCRAYHLPPVRSLAGRLTDVNGLTGGKPRCERARTSSD